MPRPGTNSIASPRPAPDASGIHSASVDGPHGRRGHHADVAQRRRRATTLSRTSSPAYSRRARACHSATERTGSPSTACTTSPLRSTWARSSGSVHVTTTPQSTPSIVATAGARLLDLDRQANRGWRRRAAAADRPRRRASTPARRTARCSSSTTAPANSAAVVNRRLPGLAAVPGGRRPDRVAPRRRRPHERPLSSSGRTATPPAVGSATSRYRGPDEKSAVQIGSAGGAAASSARKTVKPRRAIVRHHRRARRREPRQRLQARTRSARSSRSRTAAAVRAGPAAAGQHDRGQPRPDARVEPRQIGAQLVDGRTAEQRAPAAVEPIPRRPGGGSNERTRSSTHSATAARPTVTSSRRVSRETRGRRWTRPSIGTSCKRLLLRRERRGEGSIVVAALD